VNTHLSILAVRVFIVDVAVASRSISELS
jgi:hypothetical protein